MDTCFARSCDVRGAYASYLLEQGHPLKYKVTAVALAEIICRGNVYVPLVQTLSAWRRHKAGVFGPGFALPKGEVEQGESIHAAAERELKEETGIDIQFLSAGVLFICDVPAVHPGDKRKLKKAGYGPGKVWVGVHLVTQVKELPPLISQPSEIRACVYARSHRALSRLVQGYSAVATMLQIDAAVSVAWSPKKKKQLK